MNPKVAKFEALLDLLHDLTSIPTYTFAKRLLERNIHSWDEFKAEVRCQAHWVERNAKVS